MLIFISSPPESQWLGVQLFDFLFGSDGNHPTESSLNDAPIWKLFKDRKFLEVLCLGTDSLAC